MGTIRNNQSREVTKKKILSLIRTLLAQGENAFPSERELAVRTGGSRGVIRGILEELESQDRLRQTPNGRILNPRTNRIPLLFAAIGRNMVENRSWAKLWFTLARMAPEYGIQPELILVGWPNEKALPAIRQIQESNTKYLIVTCHELFEWNQFDFDSKFTIFPDEDASRLHRHVICLDNREAGRLAAHTLFEAGFRRPALIQDDFSFSYLPLEERAEGFREACRTLDLPLTAQDFFPIRLYVGISEKETLQRVVETGERIAGANRYDSLFYVTDERVPLLCDTLMDLGIALPEQMGIISLNATNTSQHYRRFPFTTVSAATEELAAKILETVAAEENGESIFRNPVRVRPGIHNIESLYKKKGHETCA